MAGSRGSGGGQRDFLSTDREPERLRRHPALSLAQQPPCPPAPATLSNGDPHLAQWGRSSRRGAKKWEIFFFFFSTHTHTSLTNVIFNVWVGTSSLPSLPGKCLWCSVKETFKNTWAPGRYCPLISLSALFLQILPSLTLLRPQRMLQMAGDHQTLPAICCPAKSDFT